jgi:hypothetical protein
VAPATQDTSSLGTAETRIGAVIAETTPERDPRTLHQEAEPMKGFYIAIVRNGRLVLDELVALPDGTLLELVSVDHGSDPLDAEEQAELARDLDASFAEEEAGELIDAADAITDLKTRR